MASLSRSYQWHEDDDALEEAEQQYKRQSMTIGHLPSHDLPFADRANMSEQNALLSNQGTGRPTYGVHIEDFGLCFSPACHYYMRHTTLCCCLCWPVFPLINHCWRLTEQLSIPPTDEIGGEVIFVDVRNATRADCLCSYFCCSVSGCGKETACHKGMLTATGPYLDFTFKDPHCCDNQRHFVFTTADTDALIDAISGDPYLSTKVSANLAGNRYAAREPFSYCHIL